MILNLKQNQNRTNLDQPIDQDLAHAIVDLLALVEIWLNWLGAFTRAKVLECDEGIVGHLVRIGLVVNVGRFILQRLAPPLQLWLEGGPLGAGRRLLLGDG